jgi:gliding motility-associated-like protein
LATETGSTCEFRAYFTANQGCESILSIDLPAANLPDDAGTITHQYNGVGTNPYVMCIGDELTILSNGDWSIPPIAPGNDPSVVFFLYSCPPSPGGVGVDPANDPCFEGFIGAPGVVIENDGTGIPVPNTTDNTFYVVPMTLGTLDGLTYWVDCYDLAIDLTTEVQFLNEITYDVSESCAAGSVTISNLQGGYPEFHGGNFTGSNLLPASASFVNSTAAIGGQIVIDGLVDGDAYSFDITDDNGCPMSISGVFSGLESATISYDQPAYCIDETNPIPVINGVQGGTFSSTAGLVIDPVTGEVNLAASTPGTYTVTYQTPDPVCFITTTTDITINDLPVVVAGNDIAICVGESAILTASGADSYVWDNGVVQGQPFFPTETGDYMVTGSSAEGCSSTDQLTVTVIEIPAPTFIGDSLYGCVPMTTNFSDLTDGDYQTCLWDFGDGQTSTSCDNAVNNYQNAGCYDVTLTLITAEGCSNTTTLESYVCLENDPVADFTANPTEMSASNPSVILTNSSSGATSYEWNFGDGSGISTSVSPTHVYSGMPNTYTITLTAYTDAGCSSSTTQVVVVGEDLIFYVPNAFTPDNDEYNQFFTPVFTSGFDPYNYTLLIFNRWGEVLFESNNAEVGWDGTYGGQIVQDGTYVWKITYKIDGVDKRQEATGHVTLIR